jgi:hypothetical protein
VMPEASVLMVSGDLDAVEADLAGGRLACPDCRGVLGPWAHARSRTVRDVGGEVRVRPRRSQCRSCKATHVLLPDGCLLRRRDSVEVIGSALVEHAAGVGHRRIAARLDVPPSTVRGWLRRFRRWAIELAAFFVRWTLSFAPGSDPPAPTGSPVGDAVEAVGLATRAAVLRFGSAGPWRTAARLTGGGLLSNTNCLWLAPV